MRAAALCLISLSIACGSVDSGTDVEGSVLTSGVHQVGAQPDNSRPVPYHGGPVIHRAQMVNLYWGSYFATQTGANETSLFDAFKQAAGGTRWFNIATQYTDADGPIENRSIAGPTLLVPTDPPALLTDTAIRHFLTAQLTSGAVAWNPGAVYFIYTPPQTVVQLGQSKSCTGFCGYHEHYKLTLPGVGTVDVLYASIPHLACPSACGTGSLKVNGTLLDSETSAMSHELLETVTDPLFNGWEAMKANDEVGDRCENTAQNFAANWGGERFAVQQIWSNRSASCVDGM
jgi:hypothetical protein